MKNKKGFTLVEVLAVIVALSVIILIATFVILNKVNQSREKVFITEVESTLKSTSYDSLTKDKIGKFAYYAFPNSGLEALTKEVGSGFMVKDENEQLRVSLWNSNISKCAVKSFSDTNVTIDNSIKTADDCSSFLPNLKGNEEVSVKGLTGLDVDYKLKASCFTIDENGVISDFDTTTCGTVLVVPNKISDVLVTNFSEDFYENTGSEITDLYMIGLTGIKDLNKYFMHNDTALKNVYISNNKYLGADELVELGQGESAGDYEQVTVGGKNYKVIPHTIGTDFLTGCTNIEKFYFTKMNMKAIPAGMLNPALKLTSLTFEELPKLENVYSLVGGNILTGGCPVEKIVIKDLDSVQRISNGAFYIITGDTDVVISNNDELTEISNGAFSESKLRSLTISNNPKLSIMQSGFQCTTHDCYIDKLEISNNENLETLQNSFLAGYELGEVTLKNLPKLKNIRYGAFSGITVDVLDLSDLPLEKFDFTGFYESSIDTLILPSTITSFDYGTAASFDTIVNEKIEFGGSDKCSLIDLFRTNNGNGTYTYLVDESKLPSCP